MNFELIIILLVAILSILIMNLVLVLWFLSVKFKEHEREFINMKYKNTNIITSLNEMLKYLEEYQKINKE